MIIDPIKLARACEEARQRHKYQERMEEREILHAKELGNLKISLRKTRQIRLNDRTEVIATAVKEARVPDNPHSVLETMRDLARTSRFTHLLGYVPREGFQWMSDESDLPKYQSEKDALAAIRRYLKNHAKNF